METREIGWTESVSHISPEEWNAGKTLEDVRKATEAYQSSLSELDARYRAERSRILEQYACTMEHIMAGDNSADMTKEIPHVTLVNGTY